MDRLPLPTELLLLVHDDTTGRAIISEPYLRPALAGAVLVELTLTGALALEGEGKQARFRLAGAGASPMYGDVFERVEGEKVADALARLGGARDFKNRPRAIRDAIFTDLQTRGLGEWDHKDVVGLPVRRQWHVADGSYENLLRQRLHESLHLDGMPDTRDAALLSVLDAMDLLPKVFRELDKRFLKDRATHISEGQWGSAAIRDAIRSVRAAVAAAAATSVVIASS